MSDPAGTKFDGDYSEPVAVGPLIEWRDQTTQSKLYRQKYHQTASTFEPAARGSAGPEGTGATLVEETQPADLDVGGVVEFDRTWAVKPATRKERQPYVHNYQVFVDTDLVEVALLVSSVLTYEYFETADGSGVPSVQAPRWVRLGNTIFSVDGTPSTDGSGVAHQPETRRWMPGGNIWERVTRTVPSITAAAA